MPWAQSERFPEELEKPVKRRLDKRDSKVYACACMHILEVKIMSLV